MYESPDSPESQSTSENSERYRTVEFGDGVVVFDRTNTDRWIYVENTVQVEDNR